MLTQWEKKLTEITIENKIIASKNGINTKYLLDSVYNTLRGSIPNLNRYHLAGMLSWVCRAYNHTFLVRKPGHSIIV